MEALEKEHKIDLEKVEQRYINEIEKFQIISDNKVKDMAEESKQYKKEFEEIYFKIQEENQQV